MAQSLKEKLQGQTNAPASQDPGATAPDLAVNPEIQAKIDRFKQDNPKYVEYLKNLPRERVENIAILRRVELQEQKERMQQATVRKLEQWLGQHPDAAQKIAERLQKIPQEKQAGAKINMIRNAIQQDALRPGSRQSV